MVSSRGPGSGIPPATGARRRSQADRNAPLRDAADETRRGPSRRITTHTAAARRRGVVPGLFRQASRRRSRGSSSRSSAYRPLVFGLGQRVVPRNLCRASNLAGGEARKATRARLTKLRLMGAQGRAGRSSAYRSTGVSRFPAHGTPRARGEEDLLPHDSSGGELGGVENPGRASTGSS